VDDQKVAENTKPIVGANTVKGKMVLTYRHNSSQAVGNTYDSKLVYQRATIILSGTNGKQFTTILKQDGSFQLSALALLLSSLLIGLFVFFFYNIVLELMLDRITLKYNLGILALHQYAWAFSENPLIEHSLLQDESRSKQKGLGCQSQIC